MHEMKNLVSRSFSTKTCVVLDTLLLCRNTVTEALEVRSLTEHDTKIASDFYDGLKNGNSFIK